MLPPEEVSSHMGNTHTSRVHPMLGGKACEEKGEGGKDPASASSSTYLSICQSLC